MSLGRSVGRGGICPDLHTHITALGLMWRTDLRGREWIREAITVVQVRDDGGLHWEGTGWMEKRGRI